MHDGAEPDSPATGPEPPASDRRPAEELARSAYTELHRLARAELARLRPGETLQPTALVHEAYVKLVGRGDPGWEGRRHFFGAAARAMREVLLDELRRKRSLKRGGHLGRGELGEPAVEPEPEDDALQVLAALEELRARHPRQAEVVELRFLAGFTSDEVARALEVSTPTVERDWRFARAWLARRLGAEAPGGES